MAKIRGILTLQGEEVRITAGMGGPQHYDQASHAKKNSQTNYLKRSYPWVVVVMYWN